MIKIFFNILFLALQFSIIAQIQIGIELQNILTDKTKFHDIKNSVLDHYEQKLALINAGDSISIERKKIMRQLKHWNRQFWIDEYYTNDQGIVQNKSQVDLTGINELRRLPSENEGSRSQPLDWFLQGPITSNNGIGRIDVLALHPTGLNTLFAGSPHGGLFKSFNNGESWQSISSYLPSLGVAGIGINPINPNIMYILSGDKNGSANAALSNGVFKSQDGGLSWFKCAALPGTQSYTSRDLLINPSDPEKLLVATSRGIFYSWDGGISWGNNNVTNNIWDIAYKPGNSNIVYAAGNNIFYKSADGGLTFSVVTVVDLAPSTRVSIGVTPANPSKVALLAGSATLDALVGVFISLNSGETFVKTYSDTLNDLFYNYIGTDSQTGQINHNNCISISSIDENIILVGGLCIWKSFDGGYSWGQETAYWPGDDYVHPDQHDIIYKPDGTLFIANDGGVYKSNNNAVVCYFKSNGLSTSQFYHFERKNNDNSIWGGTQDNGIQEHGTNGNYSMYQTGDGFDMMTDHAYNVADGESNDQYYTINDHIYKYGFLYDPNISVPGNISFFGNLAMSPLFEAHIWVGYRQGLYFSSNGGNNWTIVAGSYPANWAVSTTRNSENIVYVSGENTTFGGGIRKYDAGNWFDMTPSLIALGYNSINKISDIDVHPDNDNKVYISTGGTTAGSKVFYTANGGISWQNWTFNLPNVPIFCIKRDDNDGVYVGTSIGVFYKRNNVNHWEPFSNSLPPAPVTEIELWMEGNVPEIWVSTFGRGIWFTRQYETCVSTLSLTGDLYGHHYKEASTILTSSQILGIGEGNIIKYNTGGKIVLQNGFRARAGTKFKTYTTGCGGVVD